MRAKLKQLPYGKIILVFSIFVIAGFSWRSNQRYTVVQGEQDSGIGRIYGYKVENYTFKHNMRITIWQKDENGPFISHTIMKSVYDLPDLEVSKVDENEWLKSDSAIYLKLQIKYHDSIVSMGSTESTEPTSIIYDFHRGEMYTTSNLTLWRMWSDSLSYDSWMSESEFSKILSELRQ